MHHNLIISFPVSRDELRELPSDYYDDEIDDVSDHSPQFCSGLCPAHSKYVTIDFVLSGACDDVSGEFIAAKFVAFMKATPDALAWSVDS